MHQIPIFGCLVFLLLPAVLYAYRSPVSRVATLRSKRLQSGEDVPFPKQVLPDEVEIKRLLGKIDVVNSEGKRDTLMRVFEAYLQGRRAFLKEYLPVSATLGMRELSTTRRAIKLYNKMQKEDGGMMGAPLPVPLVIGSLRTDSRIEDSGFQTLWRSNFPGIKPPQAGNIWLIYSWDQSSFKSLRSYPPLPQIVDAGDYFSPQKRAAKRWRFVRMIIFRTLEACDFVHRSGVSHNTLNSDSIWLTTTNEQDIDKAYVVITDLGASLSLKGDLGPMGKDALFEDFYVLSFILLELVLASFTEEPFKGARQAREILKASLADAKKAKRGSIPASALMFKADKSLTEKELQTIFEVQCNSDFREFRAFFAGIPSFSLACEQLDKDGNAAWKLLFNLMARGRLYEDGEQKRVSGRGFIRDGARLFADLL